MRVPTIPKTKEEWIRAVTTDTHLGKSSKWINADLSPTPQDARTWTWYAGCFVILSRALAESLNTGYRSVVTGGE